MLLQLDPRQINSSRTGVNATFNPQLTMEAALV